MIFLSSEKGLINVIDSWDEIESRAGFVKDLDPEAHKLAAIIGRYQFKDKIPCGLSNCHTPHRKGYIVATKDGLETNIGKDCGFTYFGVDFGTLSAKFDRDVTEKQNRERLQSFASGIDVLRAQISELRKQTNGADWVYRMTRPLVTPGQGVPSEVVREVGRMIKARNPELSVARQATEAEVLRIEAAQGRPIPRPHYIEESVAIVDGLEALYPENDLRQLLVIDLDEKLKAFEAENIDTMSFDALRRWAKWTGTVDTTIKRAAEAIRHGRRLLTRDNLKPFDRLLSDSESHANFNDYLKHLPSA